jgi:hypothetical protein
MHGQLQLSQWWHQHLPEPLDGLASSSGSSSAAAALADLPTVCLTIDTEEQLPAATAVIAAMYGVESGPNALSSLQQQQLVHAVVIADRLQVTPVCSQALALLEAASKAEQGLLAEALVALTRLPLWPNCLLTLLPTIVQHAPCCKLGTADLAAIAAADEGGKVLQLLLAVFGNLQAVWSDVERWQLLLALPLPAMQLLLSADQLQVLSEDTVLYTAAKYVAAQGKGKLDDAAAAAKAALAPLVRAPQLSSFALSTAAIAADSSEYLLGGYAQQLRFLIHLHGKASVTEVIDMLHKFAGPSSWLLKERELVSSAGGGVRLEWRLAVEELRRACRNSCEQQKIVSLRSDHSAPLGGVGWYMQVECRQQDGGTVVGLFAGPFKFDMPQGGCYKSSFDIVWRDTKHMTTPCLMCGETWGKLNYLGLSPMGGDGWDEAAWVAAGLPASGEMLLQLHVHSVR